MNYRHQFHAGNFADVMKHVLLMQLLRSLQLKEKGVLYLDTHAGRGSYDLAVAEKGSTLARVPEWPDGIGRLLLRRDLPAPVIEYVDLVRQFDRSKGGDSAQLRFYPGSPWIARILARPQDRLVLCEKHPEESEALAEEFQFAPRATVQSLDGYIGLRACLPPPERRALTLIDPAFEEQNEFEQLIEALSGGLERFPTGVFAIWYPLTERAGVERFFTQYSLRGVHPTLVMELMIAGERADKKMRGCGLMVINPPWKFDTIAEPILSELAPVLAQANGAGFRIQWLVPEN